VRFFPCLVFFAAFLCPTYPALAQSFNQTPLLPAGHTYRGNSATASRAKVAISQLPLTFEPNVGQGIEGTDYLARSGALQIGLSASRMELGLLSHRDRHTLGISLANGNTHAPLVASERGPGESNYLLGSDASTWRTHIPQYQRVTYGGVYPGVDLTFYGNREKVEHDFVVQPGADYRQIRMRYEGADQLSISRSGDLHVKLGESEVLVRAPHIYQIDNGHRLEREGKFVLLSSNEVSFQIKAFDPALTMVIDPVLDYATYLADLSLNVYGAAVDTAGNTYVVGLTFSSAYPVTAGAAQSTCSSCASNQPDIFITKFNAAGTAQVYSTFLGGSSYDQPSRIAVDSNGNAIVIGSTQSTDFPVKNPITSGTPSFDDGFVASLAPDGASLNFSSRLGGTSSQGISGATFPGGVTTDASGNVYVSGMTQSPYLPVTSGALNAGTPGYPNNYVFLTKLQSSGNLIYSAILGATGSASECCSVAGIAVDTDGNTYVAGTVGVTTFTTTTPWPITAGAYQSAIISPGDTAPFVAKVSPDASTLLYSTLVATGLTSGMALTPDRQVILVGTANYDYPVTSDAYSSTVGTSFIAKLSADASQLAYSTYFSTPTADTGGNITNVALDPAGNVWIAGNTQLETNVPIVNPLQSLPGTSGTTSGSAFVSEFDPLMHTLLFSTYFNGPQSGSRISGLAMDTQGRAHVTGTGMDDLPTTSSAYLRSVTPPPQNYTI
jgi:Beta-propeller repeat